MYQWKTSSVIHATSTLPGINLSISQLLRIERHRGSNYSALYGQRNEQGPTAPSHGVVDRPPATFSQDDNDLPAGGAPAAYVKLPEDLTRQQIPVRGPPLRLFHTSCNSRPAQFRNRRGEACPSVDKIRGRHASQSAALLPPNLKDTSKKPIFTQTGPSPSRLPQLVPNKLPTGFKAPIRPAKGADEAFRDAEYGETIRAWPMSSEERKAEAKRKEEARLAKEAKDRQAREAEEEVVRRQRQEQLRREAEAIQFAREQRNRELSEKWMARLSAYGACLEKFTAQIGDIRNQITKLLDKCERARRKLWEEKAKIVEGTFDEIFETKERFLQLVTKYSQSSNLLCSAIEEFCTAVGEDVHGERYTGLVNLQNPFLPRFMFAEGDTPRRMTHLCTIFWTYSRLKNFGAEMQEEAHLWRHLYSARIAHELHAEAFAFKPRFAHWYCRIQRFVNNAHTLFDDYNFWDKHTELIKPRASRQQYDKNGLAVNARSRRRQDLAFFLKDTATDIQRDLAQMLDRGNFVLGEHSTSFNRQQQIALRKPFTFVLEQLREIEQLVNTFMSLTYPSNPRQGKIRWFIEQMVKELESARTTVRSYLRELDDLCYWNWLATERHIPQKRMSTRTISQPTRIQAESPNNDSTSAFNQIGGIDQTWRYSHFRGPHGQQVVVDYCASSEFSERTARHFTNNRVIGIDLWGGKQFANVEDAAREGNSAKRCIPMIAIANHERIALFHIASMRFDYYTIRLSTLVRILEDPAIGKVGENVHAFRQRLLTYMGIRMDGAIELESMYAPSFGSSHTEIIINSDPALARYSRPSAIYPPEPPTKTTLSDQLKRYFGQSLRDDAANCEDLQMERITSPKLIQLSASRPYAALRLHHILRQRMQPGNHEPSAALERSRTRKTAELSLQPKPVLDEWASFAKMERAAAASSSGCVQSIRDQEAVLAEHDLGPTNIDPWRHDSWRDKYLKELAASLAKIIRGQITGITRDTDLTAYVLLTRFGQSCEDIHRILGIKEPANTILELVEATNLPLNDTVTTLLKSERESLEGSTPITRATKWIKKIIAGAPALLRMYRRSPQTRKGFEVYAMWHRLEMSVTEIAELSKKPRPEIFGLIRQTLKLGNPPFFPFQRARYLSLLREYAPKDYATEFERTTDEVSLPSAPWGATMDVLSTSGLDSFDEGEVVRYMKGLKDATSPHTFGGIKQLSYVDKAKAFKGVKALEAVKAAKTRKASKLAKATRAVKAAKMVKTSPDRRIEVSSLGKASRSTKKIRRIFSESSPTVQYASTKSPEALARVVKEKVPESALSGKGAMPIKKIALQKDSSSNKKKTDPGSSGWLQVRTVRTQNEVSESTGARRRRGRTEKSLTEKPRGSKAKASSQAGKISYNERMPCISGQETPKTKGRALYAEIPIRTYPSEGKHDRPTTRNNSSTRQSWDPNSRFSMERGPKPLPVTSDSDLRQQGPQHTELAQEQKPPKGFMDLSRAIDSQESRP